MNIEALLLNPGRNIVTLSLSQKQAKSVQINQALQRHFGHLCHCRVFAMSLLGLHT